MERNVWSLPEAVREVAAFAASPPAAVGVVTGFLPVVPGAGASSVSSSVAALLGTWMRPGLRACFVSFDTSLWGMYPLLGPPPALSVSDLTADRLVPRLEYRLDLGFAALLLPLDLPSPDASSVLSLLRSIFDVVVVDLPGVRTAAGLAGLFEELFLVVVPDSTHFSHMVDRAAGELVAAGYPASGLHLVLSRRSPRLSRPDPFPSLSVAGAVPLDPVFASAAKSSWSQSHGYSFPLRHSLPATQAALGGVAASVAELLRLRSVSPPPQPSLLRSVLSRPLLARGRRDRPSLPPEDVEVSELLHAFRSRVRWDWDSEDEVALSLWCHRTLGLAGSEVLTTLLREGGRVSLVELARHLSVVPELVRP